MKKTKTAKQKTAFTVSGKVLQKNGSQIFSKTVWAYNEKNAMENAMALLGSQNRLRRRNIQIDHAKTAK